MKKKEPGPTPTPLLNSVETRNMISEKIHNGIRKLINQSPQALSANDNSASVNTVEAETLPPFRNAYDPYEATKVIEALGFNYNIGTVFKYLARVFRSGRYEPAIHQKIEDLEKAAWYLAREISLLKGNRPAEDVRAKHENFPHIEASRQRAEWRVREAESRIRELETELESRPPTKVVKTKKGSTTT